MSNGVVFLKDKPDKEKNQTLYFSKTVKKKKSFEKH